jgi:hypothetical protein
MIRLRQFGRAVALAMAFILFLTSLPLGSAQAAMIPTDQVIGGAMQDERGKVLAFVQRADVRSQMIALGVDPAEAEARVASLSDHEIAQIAGKIDGLPAGKGVVVAVIGAAVLIFLVLLVTDLLGLTHIFPFVNHPR